MSTEPTDTARKRALSEGTRQRRIAVRMATPYLELFPDWQRRAAFINATLLAKAPSAQDKAEQLAELRALMAEVERAQEQFEKDVGVEVQHSRLDDVRRAFGRLLTILQTALT